MPTRTKPMTLIESNFEDAIRSAPRSVLSIIGELGSSSKSYVSSIAHAAGMIVADSRLDTLSTIFGFELLSKNTIFVGLTLDKAEESKEVQPVAEWLCRYAPQAIKLLGRRMRMGERRSIEAVRLESQMNELCSSAYPDAHRAILILLGVSGEELDRMLETIDMAESLTLEHILRSRAQRWA